MERSDVIVAGAGISGLAFAYASAASGRRTTVLEREARVGGCVHSHRLGSGYWYELGAHTAYNSYGGLIEMIDGCGLRDRLLPRAKVPYRMLRGGALRSVASELSFAELAISLPRALAARKDGRSVADYYSRLVGRRNYRRLLSPFLAAVPCQSADEFPATMLFKSRPRRKDVLRTFTVAGGLSTIAEAVARRPGIAVEHGVHVTSVVHRPHGFEVWSVDGRSWEAPALAIALPPAAAATVLADGFPELARTIARIGSATIHTVGVALPKEKVGLETVAGVVPSADVFFSVVTRDVVPDDRFRAFTFHFRPDVPREERFRRVRDVLGLGQEDVAEAVEKTVTLPSPKVGHDVIVREIDARISGLPLCVTGNYFGGLSIEDCVARARAEFARLATIG